MALTCALCSKRCKLNDDIRGDWVYTKKCKFVSQLLFDDNTGKWISNGGGNRQSLAIFADLVQHEKNEKVLYTGRSDTEDGSENGLDVRPVSSLMDCLPVEGVNLRILQIKNLRAVFRKGEFGLDPANLGLRHSLLIINSDAEKMVSEIDALLAFGYLVKSQKYNMYNITKAGYEADFPEKESDSGTVFIALAFEGNEDVIRTIREAVRICGYEPVDMMAHQHNNFIMDEILECISGSRFIVCDMSIPNYGAYLEAGYAMGLGRSVILTCSEKTFMDKTNGIHFDLKQFKTEIWKDLDDLQKKLVDRIHDTIGKK